MNPDVCELLKWESERLGRRVARVAGHRLDASTMAAALRWSEKECVSGLFFLADSDHDESVRVAEASGFHLVDLRVTLGHALDASGAVPAEAGSGIRDWAEEDLPALKAIARVSHTDGRFFFDTHVSVDRAGAWYEAWIENSCRGYADRVWVAVHEGALAGYITAHCDKEGKGKIGLFAVGEHARGQGFGSRLIRTALAWFGERPCSSATVVTQGRNAAAQRVYQKCGFVTRSIRLWYHKWFDT